MSIRGFDIKSPDNINERGNSPAKKITKSKRTKVKKRVKLLDQGIKDKNNESFKI